LAPPTNVTATAVSQTKVNVAWQHADTTVTGFEVQRCTGQGCANFAKLATTAKGTLTYGDSGLTANTFYSYRVRATKGADTSAFSATAVANTGGVGGSSFTLIGAGEIMATCGGSPGTPGTSRIMDSIMTADTAAIAFVAGDALTDSTPGTTFADCYDKTVGWGKFKNRTYFAIGNGDYAGGRAAAGVYSSLSGRTGATNQGWMSFDKGNWHIIILNTANWEGAPDHDNASLQSPTGALNAWLAADLAAVPPTKCIAAISWDRRIYTAGGGTLGTQFNVKQAANLLYNAGADLLISSKDKLYARFPQTNANGVPDAKGFRQFIVGTGGRSFDQVITPAAGNPVEKQNGGFQTGSWGVLKLTLDANSYSFEFIPTVAGGFTDKSDAPVPCHN
jgi:hypothetical protein